MARLRAAIETKKSCLVVGLDPDLERLPPETFSQIGQRASGGEGATARASVAFVMFLEHVIEAVQDSAVAVKPNCAFFERYGAVGWDALRLVCQRAQQAGLLVILDAKRGDIGHTATAYADGLLGDLPDTLGPLVDAVTLSPYLGRDSIDPFLQAVSTAGKGLFILVRTSNASAGEIQDLEVNSRPLHVHVAERVREWGVESEDADGWSPVGAVVGATDAAHGATIRSVLDKRFFLVPGIGAQGGRPEDLRAFFTSAGEGVIVNASRSILFAYEKRRGPWRDAIRDAAQETRQELERVRQP